MYNLIEYCDNYADSSGGLWQFKRDEQNLNDDGSIIASGACDNAHALLSNAKIVVPLKYMSNFFRSLEMPLTNCKINLELSWTRNCLMSNIVGATTFKITSTKL